MIEETLKLFQKVGVVLKKEADIIQPDPEHGNAFHPQAEGKTSKSFRIVADESEDFWVDHP